VIADGMDFFDVFAKASAAIERARRGEGPTLIECKTYRYFGHYVGDPLTYRSKEETEKVRASRDPIDNFQKKVISDGKISADEFRSLDDQVSKAIAEAVKFAEASPAPGVSELLTDVYVQYTS
jgi:TPP-dependent pyruvate/acetoin dehydrogenase alpha subunit